MKIYDLTKALWMLNGQQLIHDIIKIQHGIITMDDGTEYYLEDLIDEYNKEYGE